MARLKSESNDTTKGSSFFLTSWPYCYRNMLELGRSQSWTRALETISGHTRMDAQPLLDYFQKLYEWLKVENQKHNRFLGWDPSTDPCEY